MNPPREHFANAGSTSPARPSASRAYAEFIERIDPGSLARAGITDADLDEPPMSLAQAVEAGWMTAEEQRMIECTATAEDLAVLGYSPDEALKILAEQRDLACASST
jgi:hypothetical protein